MDDIDRMALHIRNFADNIAAKARIDVQSPATVGALAYHRARLDTVYEAAFGSPFERFVLVKRERNNNEH